MDISPSIRNSSRDARADLPAPHSLSERVRSIALSPTIAMSERAATLKAAGQDIISLAVGEPDFPTPAHIVDAAHAAAKRGFTRYTAPDGAAMLKDAVRTKLVRDNALHYANDEIHTASGCKQVIHNALAATLNPGDEVVLFAPYWTSYPDIVMFCGGVPVVADTSVGEGFIPDPAALTRRLSTRTKWVVVNSPNNPTGAVYTTDRLAQLVAAVAPHTRAMILSDEIYEHLVFGNERHVSVASITPGMRHRVLVVNGVSKSYAMTGWRIGFAAGPRWLIEAMGKVQSQTAGSSTSIAQAAAAAALTGDQSLLPAWQLIMRARRDCATGILRTAPRLRVTPVSGAFYLFAGVARCIGARTRKGHELTCDEDVAEYLLDHAGIAVVPGKAFGMSPYLRLSFALEERRLEQACRRIVAALESLAGP